MNNLTQWDALQSWVGKSKSIFVKKLSRNDSSWADSPKNHQYGVYIPDGQRESGFFPLLEDNSKSKDNRQVFFKTFWPMVNEYKESRLGHFTSKGAEAHLTRVPKREFAGLSPASLLIGGVLNTPLHAGETHWFLVVDSRSEEAEIVETLLGLEVDFVCGVFSPTRFFKLEIDESQQLIEELNAAITGGTLEEFVRSASTLPSPSELAAEALRIYLQKNSLHKLDPFDMSAPGDAVMKISRDVEYSLYKKAELRHRAADVLRIVRAGNRDLVTAVVQGFPELNASFLSASQFRRSRAGRSFESHIGRLFFDGGLRYKEQVVTGGRRPDFVLPSAAVLKSKSRSYNEALIFSAKTTLRERWKQLVLERFSCQMFLATIDDRISSESIDEMAARDITLVVPESLKTKEKKSRYYGKENVITFREFFDHEILEKRPTFKKGFRT